MLIPMRVQSPSSIKTYHHCPRKYYYQYIAKLPTLPNIHQIRGKIVHKALEKFFHLDIRDVTKENFRQKLHQNMQALLATTWREKHDEFVSVGVEQEQQMLFFEESMDMLNNWLQQFFKKIEASPLSFKQSWQALIPVEQEQHYQSKKHGVRGFIDVIEEVDGEIRVMDYKTDKSPDVEKHRLQLAIYALLYKEKHGKLPHKAGIYFLTGKEEHVDVDESLVEFAKREVEMMHANTQSKNKIDYPKHIGPLCKWSTGQCDFYDTCFKED